MNLTNELVGGVMAALIPTLGYSWRVWLAYRERRHYAAAVLRVADNPAALAALARLEIPRLAGTAPTALLLLGAGAGLLGTNWPWSENTAEAQLPPRCSPHDCRPPARCIRGVCEADAKPSPTGAFLLPSWHEHAPGMDPFIRALSPAGVQLE